MWKNWRYILKLLSTTCNSKGLQTALNFCQFTQYVVLAKLVQFCRLHHTKLVLKSFISCHITALVITFLPYRQYLSIKFLHFPLVQYQFPSLSYLGIPSLNSASITIRNGVIAE